MNMKTNFQKLLCSAFLLVSGCAFAQTTSTSSITLFNEVLFYDGYNGTIFDKDLDDGVLRHSNSLYAVKMTPEQLDIFGDSISMNVYVRACCDNYDRIGNINLAFVPKGQETYTPADVSRIEIGRFITPFMNMNKKPDVVPYVFRVDYLKYIFKDKELLDKYDFWAEYELFGVPYAANKEIKGCKDRNDVFYGTLEFVTSLPTLDKQENNVLIPLEIKHDLNNYNEKATDTIGKTVRTIPFDIKEDLTDARLVLITSNHGANAGGEEYNRRWHYIYFDGEMVLSYKPGRTSCEPFRKYNTQGNGIYGPLKKTDAAWQSFSNWCPGDVIDTRIIALGAVPKGKHDFKITVPDAVFNEKQGYIPVSLYLQGRTKGVIDTSVKAEHAEPLLKLFPNPAGSVLTIQSTCQILEVTINDLSGKQVLAAYGMTSVDVKGLAEGTYLVNVELDNGIIETHKLLIRK